LGHQDFLEINETVPCDEKLDDAQKNGCQQYEIKETVHCDGKLDDAQKKVCQQY